MSHAFRLRAFAPVLAFLLLALPCGAQSYRSRDGEPAWLSLERGKRAFTAKDFGVALVHFDEAIAVRRDSYASAIVRLEQALQTKAGKSGGDSIRSVLSAFATEDFIQRDYDRLAAGRPSTSKPLLEALRKERISDSHRAFIDVLLLVLEYRPMEGLDDSIADLRKNVQLLSDYPEAEYWKGRVFFVEGELDLAEIQYKRAYAMAPSLEIPEKRYTILYSMADLYSARSDFVAWENVMRAIVDGNDAVIDPYLREAMMNTLVNVGFNRFMTLYRIEPSYSLEANSALAAYYLERGRAAAAEHAAIAVSMTMTKAIALLKTKDRDFEWNGLDDFVKRADASKDVSAFLFDAGWPRQMLTLADALYVAGARETARYLWRGLVAGGAAPYAAVASSRLSDPSSAVRRVAP
ncbi:MAG: hypothetical protein CVV47_05215 [Spirochaetae bacterium HGW-Spirochaetae-3]|jgi:tetratricopeptide (TPR) repeat protein|nr:MAG: hypothetical protein CVV47_05215 [Spirochaetae bacterium HGW-Spirochaetae-3]